MDNTQNVLITAEIYQIIDTAYRAILFEPVDKFTLMNYRSMLSVNISKMKNEGIIKSYSIDLQISPTNPSKIEGWVTFAPAHVVNDIVLNFNMGSDGLAIVSPEYRFEQAMKGVM